MSKGITREDAMQMVGAGWSKLINKIYDNISKKVYVMQVKEKFGGLRFYAAGATKEEFDIIHNAEKESYAVCEVCGEIGKLREDLPWILTLCDEHYKSNLEKR